MNPVMRDLEVWFVTGSQHLYGPAVSSRSPRTRGPSRLPRFAAAGPGPGRRQAGRLDPGVDRRDAPRRRHSAACVGVIAWMHTFSPAKMWIAGLTDLRKPLAPSPHAVQPRPAVVVHRHGLHEPEPVGPRRSEFAFIQTRLRRARKTVVGHWEDPVVAGEARARGAGRPSAGTRRTGFDRPFRRQHARGRGHRGRQGRGPGAARVLGQRLRRADLVAAVEGAPTRRRRAGRRRTRRATTWRRAPPWRRAARRAADGRPDRGGPPLLPRRWRLRRLHRHVRGPRRA
jgi:hypothetical protein